MTIVKENRSVHTDELLNIYATLNNTKLLINLPMVTPLYRFIGGASQIKNPSMGHLNSWKMNICYSFSCYND